MWESGAVPNIFATGGSASEGSATLGGGPDAAGQSALRAKLRKLIDAEVLPRMLGGLAKPAKAAPAKLARLLTEGCDEAFRSEIGQRLASGTPPLAIMTGVLAPTARELGRLWDNDDCDLFEVQRAIGALKRTIIEIAPRVGARIPAKAPSILLLVAPGETHLLGVEMTAILFRGAGWSVARGEAKGFHADLAEAWRDVIGFSLSCSRHLDSLAKAIVEAREVSQNPELLVLVGGPVFINRSELAERIGADFCASTVELTVQYPKALLNGIKMSSLLNSRC